jgi:ribosomal protein S27AE
MWAMSSVPPRQVPAPSQTASSRTSAPHALDTDDTTCPRCGESHDLAKVKGCIKCLKCGFKFDCNGW